MSRFYHWNVLPRGNCWCVYTKHYSKWNKRRNVCCTILLCNFHHDWNKKNQPCSHWAWKSIYSLTVVHTVKKTVFPLFHIDCRNIKCIVKLITLMKMNSLLANAVKCSKVSNWNVMKIVHNKGGKFFLLNVVGSIYINPSEVAVKIANIYIQGFARAIFEIVNHIITQTV